MARPTAILIGPLGNRCLPWNGDTDAIEDRGLASSLRRYARSGRICQTLNWMLKPAYCMAVAHP